jgi:Kae1-associated kinase Bud32
MGRQIGSGAEAIILLNSNNNIEKQRIKKEYRIEEIDTPLRRTRTKKEAKIIAKLHSLGLNVPKHIKTTEYDIEMEYIQGIQLKIVLDKHPEYAELIGKNLTIMHDNDIMHGDLTTSNIILKNDNDANNNEKLYFIDFGLSFNSTRIEDAAVDIHLFKQALESKHFLVVDEAYKFFLKGYNPKNKEAILKRLETVESRGRYKEKI